LATLPNQDLTNRSRHVETAMATAWTYLQAAVTDRPTTTTTNELSRAYDQPVHVNATMSTEESRSITGRQRLVAAGIWDAVGIRVLSTILKKISLHCHIDQLVLPDVMTCVHKIARSAMYGSSLSTMTGSTDTKYIDWLDTTTFDPRTCVYAIAIRRMLSLRERFDLPLNDMFALQLALVLGEWALRRGDLHQADAIGVTLRSAIHPRYSNYDELFVDVYFQLAVLLQRRKQWDEARKLLELLIDHCRTRQLFTHETQLLLQLCRVQLDAFPNSGTFLPALTPLEQCHRLARQLGNDGLHAATMVMQARIELRKQEPKNAAAMIQGVLPTLLQCEHIGVQADAYLCLAKSYLHRATNASEDETSETLLRLALKELSRSLILYQRCHDAYHLREVHYLQARVYHLLPNHTSKRDESARCFQEVDRYLASSESETVLEDDLVDAIWNPKALEAIAARPIPMYSIRESQ
jgi:hypothetical protein